MSNRITLIVIGLIVFVNVALSAARPQNVAGENADVAAAIRYLQELETKHGQFARPRQVGIIYWTTLLLPGGVSFEINGGAKDSKSMLISNEASRKEITLQTRN
jgi:hypothetical protein